MPLSLHLSVHSNQLVQWSCDSVNLILYCLSPQPSRFLVAHHTSIQDDLCPCHSRIPHRDFLHTVTLLSCSYPSIFWDPYCLSDTWHWPWGRGVGGGRGRWERGGGGGEYVHVCVRVYVWGWVGGGGGGKEEGGEEEEESRDHCKQHGIVWSFLSKKYDRQEAN